MLYNGMDERIQVVTTPAIGLADTRVYLYDLDHRIVGEYGATGTADIKAEYIWLMPEVGAIGPIGGDDGLGGYMPLATAVGQAGALNWLHTHHHGAPILTTNAAGTIVPYPAHAVLGFPGQFANSQQLAGAQHYYNRYRDYDVNTGRYIQADPIGLAGDDNPYAYSGGNPLRYMDPLGLDAVVLNDTFGGRGYYRADHQAILIGNDRAGWSYFSKDGAVGDFFGKPPPFGLTLPSGRETFPTLRDAMASPTLSRYERAVRIRATPLEDARMKRAAWYALSRKYNFLFDNCGDLVREALTAGGFQINFGNFPNPAWQGLNSAFGRPITVLRNEPPGTTPNPR
ncbi:MAG TPA: hypothetical protein DIU09_14555 [Hyphomonadaceae bacterium]|nr:hypothetical protein AEM38_05665 [Hyphomonadaceae bacterium UKL13-1]HCP65795.1 hypothetical protein [Hyphomonadaceae bacterium]